MSDQLIVVLMCVYSDLVMSKVIAIGVAVKERMS